MLEVLDLKEYVKANKLAFRIEVLILFLANLKTIVSDMVTKYKEVSYVHPEDCSYCKSLKKNNHSRDIYCKKHKAVYDWTKIDHTKCGIGTVDGYKFCVFSQYVLIEMKDNKGVFVIWFNPNIESMKYNIYCIPLSEFKDVFTEGFDLSKVLDKNTVSVYVKWNLFFNEDTKKYEIDSIF